MGATYPPHNPVTPTSSSVLPHPQNTHILVPIYGAHPTLLLTVAHHNTQGVWGMNPPTSPVPPPGLRDLPPLTQFRRLFKVSPNP